MESWTFVETGSTDAAFHFSTEEYLTRHLAAGERILMIWQTGRTVMLGRNQIADAEVDLAEAERLGVQIVRRSSGGGAIWTDEGTLLISVITAFSEGSDARQMLGALEAPLIGALNKFGIKAYAHSRNDIFVEGKKISGMAQYITNGVLVSHCSLLYNTDLDKLTTILRSDAGKIKSKALPSMRSHVTNLSEHLGKSGPTAEFKDRLALSFFEDLNPRRLTLDQAALGEIEAIRAQKYGSLDWNLGRAPRFSFTNTQRFPGGKLEANLQIEGGRITGCLLSGDFLALLPIRALEEKLEGLPYRKKELREALEAIDPAPFLGSITRDELCSCLFNQG